MTTDLEPRTVRAGEPFVARAGDLVDVVAVDAGGREHPLARIEFSREYLGRLTIGPRRA